MALDFQGFYGFVGDYVFHFGAPVDEFRLAVEFDRDLDAYGGEAAKFQALDVVVNGGGAAFVGFRS